MIRKFVYPILLLLLVAPLYIKFFKTERRGFVNTTMLFEGLDLKGELEKEYKQAINQGQFQLDSLELLLTVNDRINDDQKRLIELKYLKLKESLEVQHNEFASKSNQQIWEEINSGVTEFGNINGYQIIFGTGNEGNIMYAQDEIDITNQVLEYLNKK